MSYVKYDKVELSLIRFVMGIKYLLRNGYEIISLYQPR